MAVVEGDWVWRGTHPKIRTRPKQEMTAKGLGFSDHAAFERAKRFAALPTEEQERILASREQRDIPELPDHESSNPARRAERVGQKAAEAPERRSEERTRTVSMGLEPVKEQAGQYLLQQ